MANILGFVALGVCGASLLCTLLALALPYWQSIDTRYYTIVVSYHSGLFRGCSNSKCGDLLDGATGSGKSSIQAAQAMVLLGFFALVGSMVAYVLLLFVMKGRKMLGYIAGGAAIAAGFFLMIGMAVYADKLKRKGACYGAGFAFDILGWLTAWAAGGIMLFVVFTGSGET